MKLFETAACDPERSERFRHGLVRCAQDGAKKERRLYSVRALTPTESQTGENRLPLARSVPVLARFFAGQVRVLSLILRLCAEYCTSRYRPPRLRLESLRQSLKRCNLDRHSVASVETGLGRAMQAKPGQEILSWVVADNLLDCRRIVSEFRPSDKRRATRATN